MQTMTSNSSPQAPLTLSPVGDTVRMPWSSEGAIPETVVPPALAVLFRMAVGPAADYYVPRFLRREGQVRGAPGWVWPAFLFPAGWAFFRKLWGAGIGFTLLHFVGLAVFLAFEVRIAHLLPVWGLALAVSAWLVPGVIAGLAALPLLHGAVRRSVRRAEALGDRPDRVAAMLAEQNPTSVANALLLGFASLAIWLAVALPQLETRLDERLVRGRVAASIAAVAPLQKMVDESRQQGVALPVATGADALAPEAVSATELAEVSIAPRNGRLRLTFGSEFSPLAGKSLLLAPSLDANQQLSWLCVPIDIPPRLLPPECRRR
jgi:hypothetical protein